jgi:hypothetical protein
MVSDLDIWRSATVLLKQFGDGADLEAARRVAGMDSKGDADGKAHRKTVLCAPLRTRTALVVTLRPIRVNRRAICFCQRRTTMRNRVTGDEVPDVAPPVTMIFITDAKLMARPIRTDIAGPMYYAESACGLQRGMGGRATSRSAAW